ncbi:MAG TPA: GreA/GreB family elongation factor [Burkholderiales bacterium]|nr:GreA/GreB family elongation factor [Burkholderiales bacterium]
MSSQTLFMTDLDQVRLRTLSRRLISAPGSSRDTGLDLDELLDNAQVVPASTIAGDVVTMNSSMLCEGGPFGPEGRALTLVYPERADAGSGRISILSPLGRALLGARAGDTVAVETPGDGVQQVRVREIRYQPEADGNWLL